MSIIAKQFLGNPTKKLKLIKDVYSSTRSNLQNIRQKAKNQVSEVVLGPEHKEVIGKVKSLAKGGALFAVGYPIVQEAIDKGINKGYNKINNSVNNIVPADNNRFDRLYNDNALSVFDQVIQVVQEEFNAQMAKENKKVTDASDLAEALIEESNIRLTIEEVLQHIENPNANALAFVKSMHYMNSFLSTLTSYNNESSIMAFEDFNKAHPILSSRVSKLRLPDALDVYKLLAAVSETKVSKVGKKLFVDYAANVIGSGIEKMYNHLSDEQKKEYASAFKALVEDAKSKSDAEKTREAIIKNKKLHLQLKKINGAANQFIPQNVSPESLSINVKANVNKKDLGV